MSVDQSLNSVKVMGRLGKDPDVRTIPNGAKMATLSIATDEGYMNKQTNQWVDATEWHRVVVWRHAADKAERRCRKGDIVYIEGKLKTDSWEDQNNPGQKKYSTSIQAHTLKVINDQGRAQAARANGGQPPASQPMATPGGVAPEEDLPF